MSGPDMTTSGLAYWTRDVKDPRDPVGRMKLYELMHHDERATRKHHILWQFHLGWAHKDHGWTSLASVRRICDVLAERSPFGKSPLTRQHINSANRDLCEWGYLAEVEKGKGRWASRYAVNWSLLGLAAAGHLSVHPVGGHKLVSTNEWTLDTVWVDTKTVSVHPEGGQRPVYTDRAKDPALYSVSEVSSAPDAVGLAATAPAGGFEDAWRAYGKHGNKQASRQAYQAIAPNAELAEQIVERAASWCASARPGQRRMPLEKWLAAEKYDQADRNPAAAKLKPKTAKATAKAATVRRDVTVTKIGATETGARLYLNFNDCEPGDPPQADKPLTMEELEALEAATGQSGRHVVGARVFMDVDENDFVTFSPHPANDNVRGPIVPTGGWRAAAARMDSVIAGIATYEPRRPNFEDWTDEDLSEDDDAA